MRAWSFLLLSLVALFSSAAFAQESTPRLYDIGSPTVTDIWVDPVAGNNSNDGSSRTQAVLTLAHAWDLIPQGSELSGHGYRIQLMPGTHSVVPNYMEARLGTAQFPIIIQGADGPGTATVSDDFNVFNTRYLYLIDFDLIPAGGGDAFHCEQCDHLLMRGMEVSGGDRQAHETIKINQSQNVYIESSDIYGSYENAIDYVAVQYGHIVDNRIHDADDWCAYVKGGSAYIRVESNTIYNCGTGGFTAGQGSGLEYLTSPWLHYEAYDIKFINNVVYNTEGAGFGVNGGYNILAAHNTFYRVGSRSHTLEVVYGYRSCDGDVAGCTSRYNAGAWGRPSPGDEVAIGNRNVSIVNNVVYNPAGFQSQWSHFSISGPRTNGSGSRPEGSVVTDTNLRIAGNIIWNGSSDMSLGVEGDAEGCASGNPTCNEALLRAENFINTFEPQFINAAGFDFTPTSGGSLETHPGVTIASFPGGDRETTPLAPEGVLTNTVDRDFSGALRLANSTPGAISSATVTRQAADLYFPWNGYLGMTNVLEISNGSASTRTVSVILYDGSGIPRGTLSFSLAPAAQFDVIVNDLTGFQADSYGLVTVDGDGDGLAARLSVYRSGSGSEFDFAFALEPESTLLGASAVPFNTNHPARNVFGLQTLTANWLSILNLDTEESRGFTVERFSESGELVSSAHFSVAPFGRIDLDGGHGAGGPAAIGLHVITPDDSTIPYQAFITRYGAADPVSGRSYDFAFPVLAANESAAGEIVVPVSNGGGAQNWVELINAAATERTVTVQLFGSDGTARGSSQEITLPGRGQQHINASALLGENESGSMSVTSVGSGILAQSMNYYFREDGSVAAMYGLRGAPAVTGTAGGSYNLFLQMASWLRLINGSDGDTTLTVQVFGGGSELSSETVILPARGAMDLPLHDATRFHATADSYGRVVVSGANFSAHTLRLRNASESFDFVFPTAVR